MWAVLIKHGLAGSAADIDSGSARRPLLSNFRMFHCRRQRSLCVTSCGTRRRAACGAASGWGPQPPPAMPTTTRTSSLACWTCTRCAFWQGSHSHSAQQGICFKMCHQCDRPMSERDIYEGNLNLAMVLRCRQAAMLSGCGGRTSCRTQWTSYSGTAWAVRCSDILQSLQLTFQMPRHAWQILMTSFSCLSNLLAAMQAATSARRARTRACCCA